MNPRKGSNKKRPIQQWIGRFLLLVLRNYSGGIGGTGGGSIISPLPSGCTTICAPADAPSVADQRARLLVEAQRQADAERQIDGQWQEYD